mmetsp:Transcript_58432/g.167718  ORF Transcript_58432/g.167718 Transcript_58432/m.167718 type:complete len:204 (+) Transcript_58432:15-626(+)
MKRDAKQIPIATSLASSPCKNWPVIQRSERQRWRRQNRSTNVMSLRPSVARARPREAGAVRSLPFRCPEHVPPTWRATMRSACKSNAPPAASNYKERISSMSSWFVSSLRRFEASGVVAAVPGSSSLAKSRTWCARSQICLMISDCSFVVVSRLNAMRSVSSKLFRMRFVCTCKMSMVSITLKRMTILRKMAVTNGVNKFAVF